MSRIVPLVAVAAGVLALLGIFTISRSRSPDREPALDSSTPAAATAKAPAAAGEPPPEAASRPAPRRGPAPAPRTSTPGPDAAPAPARGTLRIEADVPGAQVFIDRRFIGTAPVTVEDLVPGPHQLNVSAPGFDGIAQAIDVEAGSREVTVRLREVRLDASLTVVHRHRLGSCSGQLSATPAGIRYETANPEDGFSAALGDLDVLQVNYEEKTLRLKVRGGREYTFTDPDGNADRLFVFHREVERARQQLAAAPG